ncbi:hypothetical protein ILYODFUR_036302, partial [Ilyodon furcidens]
RQRKRVEGVEVSKKADQLNLLTGASHLRLLFPFRELRLNQLILLWFYAAHIRLPIKFGHKFEKHRATKNNQEPMDVFC